MRERLRGSIRIMGVVLVVAGALNGIGKEIPENLPKPDQRPPDETKPIQVFIMSGQSNMVGMGRPEPLKALIDTDGKFTNLVDEDGNWAVRNDVFFVDITNTRIARWLTVPIMGRTLGPEAQFGHIMGYHHDEVVLIIKIAQGNRSISFDIMPPSSRVGFPKEGKFYKGWQYDAFIADAHKILNNLKDYYPDYKGQGYEIAGFCWWQGHKDGGISKRYYERHLVNLINDFRAEFNARNAPFVVATVGFGGMNMSKKYLEILKAQMAVGDPEKYPEFAGNVKSFDTRKMGGGNYHYNSDGGTYTRVGDAMGRAMAALLNEKDRQSATETK